MRASASLISADPSSPTRPGPIARERRQLLFGTHKNAPSLWENRDGARWGVCVAMRLSWCCCYLLVVAYRYRANLPLAGAPRSWSGYWAAGFARSVFCGEAGSGGYWDVDCSRGSFGTSPVGVSVRAS